MFINDIAYSALLCFILGSTSVMERGETSNANKACANVSMTLLKPVMLMGQSSPQDCEQHCEFQFKHLERQVWANLVQKIEELTQEGNHGMAHVPAGLMSPDNFFLAMHINNMRAPLDYCQQSFAYCLGKKDVTFTSETVTCDNHNNGRCFGFTTQIQSCLCETELTLASVYRTTSFGHASVCDPIDICIRLDGTPNIFNWSCLPGTAQIISRKTCGSEDPADMCLCMGGLRDCERRNFAERLSNAVGSSYNKKRKEKVNIPDSPVAKRLKQEHGFMPTNFENMGSHFEVGSSSNVVPENLDLLMPNVARHRAQLARDYAQREGLLPAIELADAGDVSSSENEGSSVITAEVLLNQGGEGIAFAQFEITDLFDQDSLQTTDYDTSSASSLLTTDDEVTSRYWPTPIL